MASPKKTIKPGRDVVLPQRSGCRRMGPVEPELHSQGWYLVASFPSECVLEHMAGNVTYDTTVAVATPVPFL
jgi:hypothetical protein